MSMGPAVAGIGCPLIVGSIDSVLMEPGYPLLSPGQNISSLYSWVNIQNDIAERRLSYTITPLG